ncbi:thioesterase family protein [Saccharopolyspora sp. WRP15-2]|uniref:Thioesterase family protein n=1 Tax=Saccharopolyspora oryzae TaxID=2997343 RepID=A0ABT4UQV4_9PSEU|nr:acyl-CoA thioesterase domain-containing protein [Saccharopolyspora oryzae]MDA3624105.1 thioesterase family protein [Saccharopolyspora oryzae]
MHTAFFQAEGAPGSEILHPQSRARAQWGGGGQLRGMAVSGALARVAEQAAHQPDSTGNLRPARWTLDLFRPASVAPCSVAATVVRRGRRICLVDSVLHQQDRIVARGSALFLAAGGPARGKVWCPDTSPSAPPPALHPSTAEPRLYYSDDIGWTGSPQPHQNSSRKMTWHFPSPVVEGEQPTPFQQAAMVADVVNIVTNWGDAGLEFINADVTLALARLPETSQEMGLACEQRIEEDGVAVGNATVFDRRGILGMTSVSALLNASDTLDPREVGTGQER